MVLSVSFEIFSGGLRRAGDLEDYSQALLVAQSKIASAGTEQPLKDGQTQGETADRRFRWTLAMARTDEGLAPDSKGPYVYMLFRVDVKVDWQAADGRARTLSLSTLGLGSGL
jgi:hypothetical protein